jgi:hypothetical protein
LDETADGKPRNGYDRKAGCSRIEHPIRDLVGTAVWLPEQEIVTAIMFMVASNQNGLTRQRVKRIGHQGFECQKPGIMAPAPAAAPSIGP